MSIVSPELSQGLITDPQNIGRTLGGETGTSILAD